MLSQVKLNTFYDVQAPYNTINFISSFGVWISGTLILVGVSSIFTKEYTSGVDQFIFTSKLGRKAIVTAKVFASLIYSFLVVSIWAIYDYLCYFISLGDSGWQSPIQFNPTLSSSPYSFTMLESFIVGFLTHLIGAFGFTILVLFISAICKKSLPSFFIGATLFGVPVILSNFPNPFNWLTQFSYTKIMEFEQLFNGFTVYNALGFSILQPIVVLTVSIIISAILLWLTYRLIKQKEIAS
jgi:hypothetical protein